jgi:hypothetical protein
MSAERRTFLAAVSDLWTEFCDTTTLHGWARLLGKSHVEAEGFLEFRERRLAPFLGKGKAA